MKLEELTDEAHVEPREHIQHRYKPKHAAHPRVSPNLDIAPSFWHIMCPGMPTLEA